MNSSAITTIKWLHGYENLFMAAFQDGSVMLFDKDKEDEPFHPDDGPPFTRAYNEKNAYSIFDLQSTQQKLTRITYRFKISKPLPKTASKCNPVSHWKLSNKSITGTLKLYLTCH